MFPHKRNHLLSLLIGEDDKVVVDESCDVKVSSEELNVEKFGVFGVNRNQIESELSDNGGIQDIVEVEEIFVILLTRQTYLIKEEC